MTKPTNEGSTINSLQNLRVNLSQINQKPFPFTRASFQGGSLIGASSLNLRMSADSSYELPEVTAKRAFIIRKNEFSMSAAKVDRSYGNSFMKREKTAQVEDRGKSATTLKKIEGSKYLNSLRQSIPNNDSASDQKYNIPKLNQTLEDSVFNSDDIRFMSQLRSSGQDQTTSSKLPAQSQIALPPSFYDEDMEKFKNKFKKSIENRKVIKSILKRKLYYGEIKDVVEPQNQQQPKDQKRLPSRQSNTNFCNVDFDYYGNSREILHLLNTRNSGSPNLCQVQFETNLRKYRCQSNFSPKKPWSYIPTEKTEKILTANQQQKISEEQQPPTDQSQQYLKYIEMNNTLYRLQLKKKHNMIYRDKFRDRNANQLRHLFDDKNININSMLWEGHLRDSGVNTSTVSIKKIAKRKEEKRVSHNSSTQRN